MDRIRLAATFIAVAIGLSGAGCAKHLRIEPGRDSYYVQSSQLVPAQASGSHSQETHLAGGGGGGNVASPVTTSTQ